MVRSFIFSAILMVPSAFAANTLELEAPGPEIAVVNENYEMTVVRCGDFLTVATEFYEKLKRNTGIKPAFKVGEYITGSFTIGQVRLGSGPIDTGKVELTFDDGRIDTRDTDMFTIDVDPPTYEMLMTQSDIRFNATLFITGQGSYEVSNMFRYPAQIVGMSAVETPNPTPLRIAQAPDNTSMRTEGVIESIVSTKNRGRPDKTTMTVRGDDGEIVSILLITGIPQYETVIDAQYETLTLKKAEVGDRIRITGFTSSGILKAHWTGSSVLLVPNAQRQAANRSVRTQLNTLFEKLGAAIGLAEYQKARSFSSEIIKIELTTPERRRFEALIAIMPDDERPLLFWDRFVITDLHNVSVTADIDQMTRAEFYQFLNEFSQGQHIMPLRENGRDLSYLFRLFKDVNVPHPFRMQFYQKTAFYFLDQFGRAMKDGIVLSEGTDWDYSYNFSQTLGYMCHAIKDGVDAESVAEVLIKWGQLKGQGMPENFTMEYQVKEALKRIRPYMDRNSMNRHQTALLDVGHQLEERSR